MEGVDIAMKKRFGFTLIELLIVVAIIAILAAIAVPNFLEAQTRSKVSRCKADMRSIATALEAYSVDYTKYPINEWAPIIGSAASLRRLTTPIAFITNIPKDVFRLTLPEKFSGANAAKNANGIAYFEYWNYRTEDGWDVYGWSLRSMGPDSDLDLCGAPIDAPGESVSPLNGIYDSTNGTISNGDIIRFGGGASLQWFIGG